MVSSTLNPQNRKDNVKMLRRHLRLTQREFIDQFLCDENGKALLSIATLSNLESSGGARLNELIAIVSERLHLDPMIFSNKPRIESNGSSIYRATRFYKIFIITFHYRNRN